MDLTKLVKIRSIFHHTDVASIAPLDTGITQETPGQVLIPLQNDYRLDTAFRAQLATWNMLGQQTYLRTATK